VAAGPLKTISRRPRDTAGNSRTLVALTPTAASAQAHGDHLIIAPADLNWADVPSLPPGAKIAVIEGPMNEAKPFTMRLRLPADYQIPAASHSAIEHVTVISGTFTGAGLPILDAAPRLRHAESELYCAGKHLARALTVRISVCAAGQTTPRRYGQLRKSATAERAHHYGRQLLRSLSSTKY
jgi:hypothetical protein